MDSSNDNSVRISSEERLQRVLDTDHKRCEAALRETEKRLREYEARLRASEARLAKELSDTQLLQSISTRLIWQENVGELYREIVGAARLMMRSEAATLQSYDLQRDELYLLASVGLHPESVAAWQVVGRGDSTSCARAEQSRQRVMVSNLKSAEFPEDRASYRAYELSGILSVQSTPLISRDGDFLGMISTHWQTEHEPSEREFQLFDVVARQAADLLERAHVDEALREKAAWLRSQREALEAAVNGAPLATSLDPLVNTAVETLGQGARAAFYLANGDGTELHHLVGMSAEYAREVEGFKIGPESLACGLATDTGKPVLTTDVQTDPLWEPWRWLAQRFDYRGCWSFPIRTAEGNFVGTLAIYLRQPQQPAESDLELASLITNSASIIITRHTESEVRKRAEERLRESEAQLRSLNEQLEERVRDRTRELQEEVQERRAGEERIKNLLRQLVSAEEEQRRRIARELHDTFGQQLAALHVNIEVLRAQADGDASVHENLERMREVFDRLNSSVDFLAWELRPPSLDLLGLDAALDTYVKEWSQQFGIEAVYEGVAVSGLRLAADAETNLYRIFQEALQNVHKHAGAARVNVVFERSDGHAVLIIEDNGQGYDSEEQSEGRGMGLLNIRERAALVGGTVEIESQSGQGTTVFVRVPVGENAPQ